MVNPHNSFRNIFLRIFGTVEEFLQFNVRENSKSMMNLEAFLIGGITVLFILGCSPTYWNFTHVYGGDQESWYGIGKHFLEGFYQGVIPLWNPYNQGGEIIYPLYSFFCLLDPVNLVISFAGRILDIPIYHLYHFQYPVRFALCFLGFYLLFRKLMGRRALILNLILYVGMYTYFGRTMEDAVFAILIWLPWICFFFLCFMEKFEIKHFLLMMFFMGIYLGSGNYQIATGVFFWLWFS